MGYEHLLSPININGVTYRNRVIFAPTMFAHAVIFLPHMAENIYRMVECRAAGGAAEVATGEICVNCEDGRFWLMDRPIDFQKYEGADFEAFQEYADRIKKHGAVALLEVGHEGGEAMATGEFGGPYSSSEGYMNWLGIEAKPMSKEIIQKIVNDYEIIGRFAMKAGFDGILAHMGHGFLMHQFLSARLNHRTDEYGGDQIKRTRFMKEALEALRRGVGERGIIEVRVSAEDGHGESEEMTIADTVTSCTIVDHLVDIVQVSNGDCVHGNATHTFTSFLDPHAINAPYAKILKENLKHAKVAVIGGINSPELAEELIRDGYADLIALGRQGFADPDFVNKVREGKADRIRRCVRCYACYPGYQEHPTDIPLEERGFSADKLEELNDPASMGACSINPKAGFRFYPESLPQPACSRRVLIVGGGVAGLQAAVTAYERGHRVTLIDRADRLGGTVNFTDKDEDKEDIRNFKEVLIKEAGDCAEIRLNTPFSEKILEEIKPDIVLLAVGAEPVIPDIPGIETAMNAADIYDRMDETGGNVVIAGGGLVGCEIALYLAAHGKQVTVVEMQDMLCPECYMYYRNAVLCEMDRRGVRQEVGSQCIAFEEDGVTVEQNGINRKISADTVLYSFGLKPNERIIEQMKDVCGDIPTVLIGDCDKSGKIGDAVRGAYMASMNIL